MTVLEIVKKYLEDNGYDGLCNTDFECGCSINNLEPCGAMRSDCQAAYVAESPDNPDYDYLYFPTKEERDHYIAIRDELE